MQNGRLNEEMSIIKRKILYRAGLASWKTIRDLLLKTSYEECPVCIKNACHKYNSTPSLRIGASTKAEDCPIKYNPKLCREMRIAKEHLLKLRKKIDKIILQIEGLHAKEGIEESKV